MSNGSVNWTDGFRGPKHDQQALDSEHLFTRAGLGKTPFRVVTYGKSQGMCCEYCGTPCIYYALIRSADGIETRVGCDCVMKVGDGGLLRAIKNSPEYRAIQRQKRYDLDVRKQEEIEARISAMTEGDQRYWRSRLQWCGMAGRARVLKEMREWKTDTHVAGF